jgi:hypothetical protein
MDQRFLICQWKQYVVMPTKKTRVAAGLLEYGSICALCYGLLPRKEDGGGEHDDPVGHGLVVYLRYI